jgi:hypothetical protein
LVLKSGGPITFDSRSGVSSLTQVGFWAFVLCSFGVSGVARLWQLRSFGHVLFEMWLSLGVGVLKFYFEGVLWGVSSDDGRWWIPCL